MVSNGISSMSPRLLRRCVVGATIVTASRCVPYHFTADSRTEWFLHGRATKDIRGVGTSAPGPEQTPGKTYRQVQAQAQAQAYIHMHRHRHRHTCTATATGIHAQPQPQACMHMHRNRSVKGSPGSRPEPHHDLAIFACDKGMRSRVRSYSGTAVKKKKSGHHQRDKDRWVGAKAPGEERMHTTREWEGEEGGVGKVGRGGRDR